MGVDMLSVKNMYAQTVNIQTTYTPCSNNEDSCKANAHGNSHKEAVGQGKSYWYESLDKVKFL